MGFYWQAVAVERLKRCKKWQSWLMMCYTRHVITLFRVIRSSSSSSAGHRPIDCIFAIRKLIFLRSIGKLIHRAWIQFRRSKNNRKIMQCGFMDHQWASEQKFLRCPPPTAQIIRKLQNHPQSGVGGLASSRKKGSLSHKVIQYIISAY